MKKQKRNLLVLVLGLLALAIVLCALELVLGLLALAIVLCALELFPWAPAMDDENQKSKGGEK
jgi:hypothetical protein